MFGWPLDGKNYPKKISTSFVSRKDADTRSILSAFADLWYD